ncbi:hypothetical protein [Phaeovulum sp.]|uniref:hypothetical protein n=1 Tax=Phaeovulum sp. TaxID=2934796 RepID=UPI0039E6D5E4
MKRLCFFVALAGLAACTGPVADANPDTVHLSGNMLSVMFSDGVTCSADYRALPSGMLRGCAHPLRYDVVVTHESYFTALPKLFEPYASITLTKPGGRVWHYRTPKSVDPDFGRR